MAGLSIGFLIVLSGILSVDYFSDFKKTVKILRINKKEMILSKFGSALIIMTLLFYVGAMLLFQKSPDWSTALMMCSFGLCILQIILFFIERHMHR